MSKRIRMSRSVVGVVTGFMLCTFVNKVKAEEFSTGVAKTISEIPFGADVAGMGNASTATPDFSSKNPALIAVENPNNKSDLGVSGTYGLINFDKGPDVNLYWVSGSVQMPIGVLQFTGSNGQSSTGTITDDYSQVKFNRNPSIDVQYGLPIAKCLLTSNDSLYVGLSYAYGESKLTYIAEPEVFVSKARTHTVGAGLLYRIGKTVNLGATYDHVWDSTEVFFNGENVGKEKDQSDKLRLGVGIQVLPMTFVAADYQHLYFADGSHDDQYFAGIEQYLIKDILAVYGGWANGGTTAGLGIYLEHGGINFAYMHRPFRATEEFFGKAEVLMISAYATF